MGGMILPPFRETYDQKINQPMNLNANANVLKDECLQQLAPKNKREWKSKR
jgi:hypothetical protein